MSASANLALPFIEGGELLPDVTLNETLRLIDTLVQLAVADRDLNAPPGSPAEGERWIVKASPSPTGAWAGHGNHVAAWQDGGWEFSVPQTGWVAFVIDEGTLLVWNGSAWGDFFSTVTAIQNLARLGVGTTADATNPFSAKLNNALWAAKTVAEGGDGDLRYKMSKESAAKTLSLLMQTNFSGRAEVGLTGDDDFHFKVSPDGSAWHEGIRIDRNTGKVSFPVSGGPREVLTANRTYYVRTDGSDSNNGLANTSGGAFLTIQKALNAVFGTLDLGGFNVAIQLADGTYTGAVAQNSPQVGAGLVTVQGNSGTPGNVIVSVTGANAFYITDGAVLAINDLEIRTTTSGAGIFAERGSAVKFQNLRFGACVSEHILVVDGARVNCTGSYAIVGGTTSHIRNVRCGLIAASSVTVTLTGTPAFSSTFITTDRCSIATMLGITYSGSATGVRYLVQTNGVINTAGGGANYFPGNSAGSSATGGQYL